MEEASVIKNRSEFINRNVPFGSIRYDALLFFIVCGIPYISENTRRITV